MRRNPMAGFALHGLDRTKRDPGTARVGEVCARWTVAITCAQSLRRWRLGAARLSLLPPCR
jgi:hypothetical protein